MEDVTLKEKVTYRVIVRHVDRGLWTQAIKLPLYFEEYEPLIFDNIEDAVKAMKAKREEAKCRDEDGYPEITEEGGFARTKWRYAILKEYEILE